MSVDVETFANSGLLVESAGKRLIDTIQTAVAARGRALIVDTTSRAGSCSPPLTWTPTTRPARTRIRSTCA